MTRPTPASYWNGDWPGSFVDQNCTGVVFETTSLRCRQVLRVWSRQRTFFPVCLTIPVACTLTVLPFFTDAPACRVVCQRSQHVHRAPVNDHSACLSDDRVGTTTLYHRGLCGARVVPEPGDSTVYVVLCPGMSTAATAAMQMHTRATAAAIDLIFLSSEAASSLSWPFTTASARDLKFIYMRRCARRQT